MSMKMTPEILESFEQPIEQALSGYQDESDGYLAFDIEKAKELVPQPEKRYAAKSETGIYICEDDSEPRLAKAKLITVAFMPDDDTGASNSSSFDVTDGHTKLMSTIPRSKEGVHSEAHLTIAASKLRNIKEPKVFVGNLGVLMHFPQNPEECHIGFSVGQKPGEIVSRLNDSNESYPLATFTVGQNEAGKRFGDPHAILNGWENVVQVAGFIAVDESEIGILESIGTSKPAPVNSFF